MKNLSIYLSCLLLSVFLLSCSLEDHVLPAQYDIYVAGYEANGERSIAKYWKNGIPVELETLTTSYQLVATGITVSGSDVHVVGAIQVGNDAIGKYWKNGVLFNGWTNFVPKRLNDVAVSGPDVYLAGYTQNGTDPQVAAYWKNGTALFLNDAQNAQATGIVLSGNDLYVSGHKFNDHVLVARYWKNGIEVNLSDGVHQALANAIAVSGSDVHVVGYGDDQNNRQVAKYWKNGVETNLTDGTGQAVAYDVAVQGNDVYVSGFENINGMNHARVWKNGIPFKTTNDFDYRGIAVPDENVFTAGANWGNNGFTVASVWKNDTPAYLPGGDGNNYGMSLFVVKK
ncbi:hypothetical protein GCM10010967_55930 [Dyadobacter beijingensis]|uniref:Beta-propeller repeat-containing protein n=1 Tax=Dyadobacter beijingensis TaxID=365489 RepID=A0ABQ2IMK0_9BACT|nr:hypothetical protein [Dyadobacter beijingensis]GGN12742.1 hypothetical protein GCM10010967_55930 [Dyadobacter beijingensis]